MTCSSTPDPPDWREVRDPVYGAWWRCRGFQFEYRWDPTEEWCPYDLERKDSLSKRTPRMAKFFEDLFLNP